MDRAYPAVLLSLLVALSPAGAAAGGPPRPAVRTVAEQRALDAETLFDQGRKLVTQGRYAEGCAAFLESERLDHGVGTMLNLSDCYEKNGQTATAWAGFRAAAAAANAEGQPDREHIAREREIALLPQLAHLTITPPQQGLPPGAEVHRDGVLVSPWLWSAPVPVDPGDHAVLVAAPGKIDYTTTVHVPRQPAMTIVTRIPALQDRPPPSPTVPVTLVVPMPMPPTSLAPQAKAGLVLVGLGSVGAAVGAIFGVRALGLKGDSAEHCNALDHCDMEGISLRSRAHTAGTGASISFIAAGAALAGGLVLFATAPERRGMTASFGLSGGTAGVTMGATW
jgi:hypothetical protein